MPSVVTGRTTSSTKLGNYSHYRSRGSMHVAETAPKSGVPYLHIFPRSYAKQIVNVSPFVIKLETWFRMHGIRYEVVETTKLSKATKQIPYIMLDRVEYADSGLIIDMMMEREGVELSEGLTREEQAVGRAFTKMAEEHLLWTGALHRFVYQPHEFSKYFRPHPQKTTANTIRARLKQVIKRRADAHGIGRKNKDTVSRLGVEDIRAISRYLGQKTYFFGDNPTKVDCALFGQLSAFWFPAMSYPHKAFITAECPNIISYLEKIKTEFWPDWNQLAPSGTFD